MHSYESKTNINLPSVSWNRAGLLEDNGKVAASYPIVQQPGARTLWGIRRTGNRLLFILRTVAHLLPGLLICASYESTEQWSLRVQHMADHGFPLGDHCKTDTFLVLHKKPVKRCDDDLHNWDGVSGRVSSEKAYKLPFSKVTCQHILRKKQQQQQHEGFRVLLFY